MNIFSSLLETLHFLIPPDEVILVGVRSAEWIEQLRNWELSNVLLIEPDSTFNERFEKIYQIPDHWYIVNKLLWKQNEILPYYHASNPALSGLIAPESLQSLWPNLSTKDSENIPAIPLKEVLDSGFLTQANWYIIGSFPALAVLEGADSYLDSCDLIILRAISDDLATEIPGCGRQEIETWLKEKNFRLIKAIEEDHPKIQTLFFARDTKQALVHMQTEQKRLLKERDELQIRSKQLSIEKETSDTRIKEADNRNTQLEKTVHTLQLEVKRLSKSSDEETAVREENKKFKTQLEQLRQENETNSALAVERQSLLNEQKKITESLQLEIATLHHETINTEKCTEELKTLQVKEESYKQRVNSLKKQLEESNSQNDALSKECEKATQSMQQNRQALSVEQKAFAEQKALLEKERDVSVQKMTDQTAEFVTLAKDVEKLRDELKTLKENEEKYRQRINNLKMQLEESNNKNDLLTQEYEKMEHTALIQQKNKYEKEQASLKQTIADHTARHSTLAKKLEEATNNAQGAQKQVDDLRKGLEGIQKEADHSRQQLEQKSKQHQEQLYRNQMLEKEVNKLEALIEFIKDVILREKAF